jgi:hypothetical protein
VDGLGTVDAGGNGLDLHRDRHVERIEVVERVRLRRGVPDGLCQLGRALATARERVVDRRGVGPAFQRQPTDGFQLTVPVAGKRVHCDHRFEAEPADDLKVPHEVCAALFERLGSSVRVSTVVLKGPNCCNEDDRGRRETACPAHDVEKLLHAHVGAEAALGHDVVAQLQGDAVGDHRIVPVRDVREGTTVDEHRLPLERLDEVWLERVLEEDRHRTGGPELFGRNRLVVVRVCHRYGAQTSAQVVEIPRDGDDRHHLGRRRDVETGLADIAVRRSAEADDHVA